MNQQFVEARGLGLGRGEEALSQFGNGGSNALAVVRAQFDQLAIHPYAFFGHVRCDEATEFVKMLDVLVHLAAAGLEVQAAKFIPISSLVQVQSLLADLAQARDIGSGTLSAIAPNASRSPAYTS